MDGWGRWIHRGGWMWMWMDEVDALWVCNGLHTYCSHNRRSELASPKRFVAQQFNYTSAPVAAAAAAAAAAEAAAILQHVAYLCLFNLGEKKSP